MRQRHIVTNTAQDFVVKWYQDIGSDQEMPKEGRVVMEKMVHELDLRMG